MRKLIALILIALLMPMSSAKASLGTLDNYNIGTINSHVKFVPFYFNLASNNFTFPVFIDNSRNDIDMLYISLFNCAGGLVGYKRVYADEYGIDNFEDTYGNGNSHILKSFVFENNYSYIPKQCVWNSYRMQVTIWQVGMDNSTVISRAASGKYITNVIDVPFRGEQFIGSLAADVPDWKNPYTETVNNTVPSLQSHIDEINKITEGWKRATEALIANQKAEAAALILKEQAEKLKRDSEFFQSLVNGTTCKKLGSTKLAGGKVFTCKKINKKLIWKK